MLNTASIKKGYHKTGKSFVLLFNRVSMYGPGHPFSVQAVEEFYQSMPAEPAGLYVDAAGGIR